MPRGIFWACYDPKNPIGGTSVEIAFRRKADINKGNL